MNQPWYKLDNVAEIPSPALLIYQERMVENLRRMLAMVGNDPNRLRPHIKTHKVPEIIALHLERGITKFKCATIAAITRTCCSRINRSGRMCSD